MNKLTIIDRKNIHDQSLMKNLSSTDMSVSIAISPKTSPIFAIFEPTTLLIAMDGEPLIAALMLTINSGNEVAKETTVIPITNFDILNLNDNATDDLTINSPPTTSKRKPKKMNNMFIYLIIILEFVILCLFETFSK